jgi:hypothetical protein
MKNRIICVVACLMMLVGCVALCGCGNYKMFDTTLPTPGHRLSCQMEPSSKAR